MKYHSKHRSKCRKIIPCIASLMISSGQMVSIFISSAKTSTCCLYEFESLLMKASRNGHMSRLSFAFGGFIIISSTERKCLKTIFVGGALASVGSSSEVGSSGFHSSSSFKYVCRGIHKLHDTNWSVGMART